MSKEIVGHVTCPHCGNSKATVHRQAKGSKALYYRCYPEEREPCGTVQIILAGGQKWINKNMRSLNKVESEVVAEQIAQEAKAKQLKVANSAPEHKRERAKRSLFGMFLEDES